MLAAARTSVGRNNVRQNVTKLEATDRQLREAIRLHFEGRDPISIHTLAGAACELAADLSTAAGHPDPFLELVKTERMKEAKDLIRGPQNFLKHADRDPEGVLEFEEFATVFTILRALCLYEHASGKALLPEGMVFMAWAGVKYPSVLRDSAFKAGLDAISDRNGRLNPDDLVLWRKLIDECAAAGMSA
jgi:hypothetical protein